MAPPTQLAWWVDIRSTRLENPAGIDSSQAVRVGNVRSVAHQTPGHSELASFVDRGHRVVSRQRGELFAPTREEKIRADYEPAGSQLDQVSEVGIEVTFGAGL